MAITIVPLLYKTKSGATKAAEKTLEHGDFRVFQRDDKMWSWEENADPDFAEVEEEAEVDLPAFIAVQEPAPEPEEEPQAESFEEPAAPALQPFTIDPSVAAGILAIGEAVGLAKTKLKAPVVRAKLTDAAWAAAEAGKLPPPLVVPLSNAWMQPKADALRGMAEAGKLDELVAYAIGGTNTYAKALRSYRDALVAYVKSGKA